MQNRPKMVLCELIAELFKFGSFEFDSDGMYKVNIKLVHRYHLNLY